MTLIQQLQDYVAEHEGGAVNLTKPQCQEVIRLVLKFMNEETNVNDMVLLLTEAAKRERTRAKK